MPGHFIIVGGGYVGLEFAQIYRRFGSEVTIVEMGSRLIGREDEDISQGVHEILEAEGVHIRLNAKCISLETRDGVVADGITCDEGPPEVVVALTFFWPWDEFPTPATWDVGPGWGRNRPSRLT